MSIENELKKTELFSSLSGISASRIAGACSVKKIKSGEYVFHEGDEGDFFYLMQSGKARVFKNSRDGKEVTVKIISQDEIFGEVIIFESRAYPASCVAMEECEVISIRKENFLLLLRETDFSADFFGILIKKLRYLNERILFLSAMDVEERFFSFIKENYGIKEQYEISMSKKDAASAIGTIPETFSRMLARLKKAELANWDDNLVIDKKAWEIYEV